MKSLALSILSICTISIALSGCSSGKTETESKERKVDGPWMAPGEQAREFRRSYFAGMMDAVAKSETAWTTAKGGRTDARKIAKESVEYLKGLGYFDRWPESQSSYDGYQQRVAPFTFHIVAIDPVVVIMAPHDFGNPKGNRSTADIVGWGPAQSFSSKYMLNYIQYGTTVPYQLEILWFSPDLRVQPQRLTQSNTGGQQIEHKKIRIVFTKDQDIWKTKREL